MYPPDQSITEPLYTLSPKYYRDLAFRQNLPVILFFSLALGLPYMLPILIPLAINPNIFSPSAFKIIMALSYMVAYCLGILTMLAYFKSVTKAAKLVVYNDRVEYYSRATKGISKSIFAMPNIDSITISQSKDQGKYGLGTLILNLKFKEPVLSYTIRVKNIENAELYCSKIKSLKESAQNL